MHPHALYKYPRTRHLPFSPGVFADDWRLPNIRCFEGREVVVLDKMDGENVTLYNMGLHARSVNSWGLPHPTADWMKNFWSSIAHDIPQGMRICGESLHVTHAIKYTALKSFFQGFSMWDMDTCLSWDKTLEWFDLIGIKPVDTLYRGLWDVDAVKACDTGKTAQGGAQEGYVVRLADSFYIGDWFHSVAKYVRLDHVTSMRHWKYQQHATYNELKDREIVSDTFSE